MTQQKDPHQMQPLDLGHVSLQNYEGNKFLFIMNYSVGDILFYKYKMAKTRQKDKNIGNE
jgi:hypothetical protein